MSRHHPSKIEVSCKDGTVFTGSAQVSGAKRAIVLYSAGRISANVRGRSVKSDKFIFKCAGDIEIGLSSQGISRLYSGGISVGAGKGELEIINSLPLEQYVVSVTAGEMISKQEEALKAQAVLARSYALKNMGRHGSYDFCDLTHCQLYRGSGSLTRAASSAGAATAGMILTRGGAPVDVYYHSSCGGKTTSPRRVWGEDGATFPKGIDDGNNCSRSPQFRWEVVFTPEELESIFGAGAPVDGVRVIERDPSGRVAKLVVKAGRSNRVFSGIEAYRKTGQSLGWGRLKSAYFDVTKQGNVFIFRGRGLGHGVGMCQWGADGMARNGATYVEILKHYFPGTEIRKVAN